MTTYSKKFITYMGQIYIDFILGMAEGREHCKTYQINCILLSLWKYLYSWVGRISVVKLAKIYRLSHAYVSAVALVCVRACERAWVISCVHKNVYVFSLLLWSGQMISWKWNTKQCVNSWVYQNSFRFIHLGSGR